MEDALTNELIKQLNKLPIHQKKTLLEFIKSNFSPQKTPNIEFLENWKKQLLTTSIWSEVDLKKLQEAREYTNKWNPPQFS